MKFSDLRKSFTVQYQKYLNNPLFRNILIVGGISLLAKGIGFYKETLVASEFGLSLFLDSFLIAFLIPTYVQSVFITSLRNIFVPGYITELNTTKRKAQFQSTTFIIIILLCLVLIFISYLFSVFLLEVVFPNDNPTFYLLIRKQLYVLLPCILLWGISSIFGALLEIDNKFYYSTYSSLFIPLTSIVCLLYFQEELKEYVLAVGFLVGSLLSLLYLLYGTVYFKLIALNTPRLNSNIVAMLKQLPPKMISGFLSGMNTYIDQFFAAQLIAGSISALSYGKRIPAFIISLLMIGIGNVLLPHFSKMLQTDLKQAFLQLFKVLKIVFGLGLGVGIILLIFSEPIITMLFERNEFTSEDSILVSRIQQILVIYVPFYLCTLIMVKFLTSYNKNSFMAWVSFFMLIFNFVFNYYFVKYYGIYGLALSTTAVYIINSLIFYVFTKKEFTKVLVQT